MDKNELIALVEAILLTAKGPTTASAITEAVGDESVGIDRVAETLNLLAEAWDQPDRGIRLEQVGGGWRSVTLPNLDPYLKAFHGISARQRLSQAALEVLAIAAHRQPVTIPEINFIRGANSAGVVRNLLDRRMLRMAGRKKVVGKPFLYRTTKEFLIHFGLDRAEDLPDPEELVKEETTVAD